MKANRLIKTGHCLIKFTLVVMRQPAGVVNTRGGEITTDRK
jgi:hypothetical protein